MNLIKVSIANFKQYVEPVEIPIPSQAAIGVIGANGVGKTTLFQAIEWCLYNPSGIRDIRPRGRTGNPKVIVTLESRDGSKRWEVERELKRSATAAAIYEIDESGMPRKILDGTRDVTRFVETRLIDLSHRAFCATFFTRQKELHFFGDLPDTERRREVGKLLGLETIRTAQQAIGKDRQQARNHATFAREQYDRAIEDRDLAAEIAAATAAVTGAAAAIAAAKANTEAAISEVDSARTHLTTQQQVRERHLAVKADLDQAQREQASASEQLAARERDLARFASLRVQRTELLPVAAEFDAREATVGQYAAEFYRHNQRGEVQRRLDRLRAAHRNDLAAIRRDVLAPFGAPLPPAWRWDDADDAAPAEGVDRLRQVAAARPIAAATARIAALRDAQRAASQHQDAISRLARFRDRLASLERQLEEATERGSPEEERRRIDAEEAHLNRRETAWTIERQGIEDERKRRQRVLDSLLASTFDDGCPTCGRPFSTDDASQAIELFQRDIAELHRRMQEGDRASAGIRKQREALATQRAGAETRRQALEQLRANLIKGRGATEEQEQNVEAAAKALQQALRSAGLESAPSGQDLAAAEQAEALARQMGSTLDRIEVRLVSVVAAATDIVHAGAEIAAFGEIRYDAEAHDRAIKARDAAQRAQTAIAGFDRELAQEASVIAERDRLASRIGDLERAAAEAKQRLFDVGFDPEVLQAAETALGLAEQRVTDARAAAHQAELDHQRAVSGLAIVQAEHDRLQATLKEADDCQREADELQQMYDEFAAFEQWVVSRLTPTLGELTSAIVAQVTDGRYDEVTFDENFGIQVRDGDDAHPLAQFSGGERDVISLAARLALSQLIGAQAADQPGFLVLDEVFGSLDSDRRQALLKLLGSLGGLSDRFQQVFIISHVDDVRLAPGLDDIWRVNEVAAGVSTIESLPPGTDIGAL